MIGHVFETSGATCLAVAPAGRAGDYLGLVRYEDQYAVVLLDAALLVNYHGRPPSWLRGDYYPTRDEAVQDFADRTGLEPQVVRDQVSYAERALSAHPVPSQAV